MEHAAQDASVQEVRQKLRMGRERLKVRSIGELHELRHPKTMFVLFGVIILG